MRNVGLKIIIAVVFLLSVFAFQSCSDDIMEPGVVRFTCASSNPYDLFVDGEFELRMQGKTFIDYTMYPGIHSFEFKQVSGYLFYPTVGGEEFHVESGDFIEFVFP